MKLVNEILCHLKIDEIRNVSMMNFINNYPTYYTDKVGNSFIVKGKSDRDWIYISSESREELQTLKEKLEKNISSN